jgi:flagellar hook-associated protein 1
MFVNERALDVTGHNITNVSTPGYVRQQAMISSAPYQTTYVKNGMQQFGLGADIDQIRQVRHMFLDEIYRQENTAAGYWEARYNTIQEVQAILGEPMEDGMQDILNKFWDSWQELSKNPESLTLRAMVTQCGENMVDYVNHLGIQLDGLQNDMNTEIALRVNEINDITSKIAKLNIDILAAEVIGDRANDYRDQRNVLIDRLSNLIDIQSQEMQDGQIDIVCGGHFLVSKDKHRELYAGESSAGSLFVVPKLKDTDAELPLKSGLIKGLLVSRGEVSGAQGSIGNGSPNDMADVVFAVDVSNTSAGYLANVKANITQCIDELEKWGLDYNLRLITYGDNVISSTDFGTNGAALEAAIPAVPAADAGNNFGGVSGLLEELESLDAASVFRENANRYTYVFTGESLDGDGGAPVVDPTAYIDRLNAISVKTNIVTDTSYYTTGDPVGEAGWESIAQGTGGAVYDVNTPAPDYVTMMDTIASDIEDDVSFEMGSVEETENIVSSLRTRLNALINTIVREVNYLHKSGQTLSNPPLDGEDFFVAVNSSYPVQMENIRLNANLSDLDNVAASGNGDAGDNTIALTIANLRHKDMLMDIDNIVNADEYYRSIILDTGNRGAEAESIYMNQQELVHSSDNYRQSIAGVSMDEEMTNMMKFKFAYNASSRVMNVVDEMIEQVISRMGIVGR